MSSLFDSDAPSRFSDEARQAIYEVIRLRRDVRHFDPAVPVDDATLRRILEAAHQAPSVGLSQPWAFVVVREPGQRGRIRDSFLRCREAEAGRFPEERRKQYLSLRLEGIVEAPINLCVCVDLRPSGEAILGTTVQPESVRASVVCAVQNLWLAARAEGVGVGWVSIVEPAILRAELGLPGGVHPVAYLCIGAPRAFRQDPMLEETGWKTRAPVEKVIHEGRFRSSVAPPDARSMTERFKERDGNLTKPPGSLGKLEDLALRVMAVRGRPFEAAVRLALPIFVADHGVVVEGVSAYGSQLTAAMVANVMAGGAAVNVLARRHGVELSLVDVGIAGDLSAAPTRPAVPLIVRKVAHGTANLRVTDAMTRGQAEAALEVGAEMATSLASSADVVGVGEIGIGNTTAAAAVIAGLLGVDPEKIVGRGTGVDDSVRMRKVEVVRDALGRVGESNDGIGLAASLGGLELVAMAGFMLRAHELRLPVVLDGFLSSAAALIAQRLNGEVTSVLLASHLSAELGARLALERLGVTPILDLGLRLGEGTGAILAMSLVVDAIALHTDMATFATAGVR